MEVSRAEAEGPGTWGMCICSYWVLQTSMPTFCCLAFALSLTLTMLSCPWEQHMLFLWKSWQLVRYFCPKEWISFTKGVWVPVFLTFFPLLVEITRDRCMAEILGVLQVQVHCQLSIIGNRGDVYGFWSCLSCQVGWQDQKLQEA